jgi:CRISPR-associated protein Csx10
MSNRRLTFSIRLDMLSDWTVGAGGGRQGALDSVVQRDADELPYIPATTLRGIWRDAAEQLAYGLAGGKLCSVDDTPDPWCTLVDHVFGSQPAADARGQAGGEPIASRLVLSDAGFAPELRAALRGDARRRLRNALVIVKPGVAIDERSGRAKTDFLRFEEAARQGAELYAQCSIALTGEKVADEAMTCLALAATRLVERIGGNRRRGAGRCAMTVSDIKALETAQDGSERAVTDLPANVAAAVERLDKIEPSVSDPSRPDAHAARLGPSAQGKFIVVPLDVEIETAAVVADSVLGNVVTSLDYIPGTMLLSGVARMLAAAGADGSRISAAFANDDIRVLPAYPVIRGRRGLPAPLVLERKKDSDEGGGGAGLLRNRLRKRDGDRHAAGEGQYKSMRGRYFALRWHDGQPLVRVVTPLLGTRTHNSVEDARQKPTAAMGGVFTYESIPAGTRLRSAIWIRHPGVVDEPQLARLKAPGARQLVTIGRAKKAGYGAVWLSPGPEHVATPTEPSSRPETFTLYLASDMLLPCAPLGAFGTSPEMALCAAIRELAGAGVEIVCGEVRTGRTEGWVARWGLPRSSYILIQAGSTVVVKSNRAVDIAKLVDEGIGMRRAEGFGHVLVDPDFLAPDLVLTIEPEGKPPAPPANVVMATGDFARKVERAALRGAIRLQAESVAAEAEGREQLGWSDHKPNMSQLGALRAAMGGLEDTADVERAGSFVARLMTTDRVSKWGGDNVSDKSHPLAVLHGLFAEPRSIWRFIGLDLPQPERLDPDAKAAEDARIGDIWRALLLTRGVEAARADPELQRFAIASFLHAAMLWHKRASEPHAAAGEA